MDKITIIGGGLAGVEAAWVIANAGVQVDLIDMKPIKYTPAHKKNYLAELVCSNSLKAARFDSAAGLLKNEMRKLGSICLMCADIASVEAGGALAVDRDVFSSLITEKISKHPNINVISKVVDELPDDNGIYVIATGPLTDDLFAKDIIRVTNSDGLHFYDAAAPIVSEESIDFSIAFRASRYDEGQGDYVNCPMSKAEYEAFHDALVNAEGAPLHEFDKDITVYEGCMPVEVLAKRGKDAIRFGPLKPVGLVDPRTGHRPWACVQLRKENTQGSCYNLVGFQTNLKFGEQKRVFSMIPGLCNAEFLRYGVMHRNTFINSPQLLNRDLSLKMKENVFFAGQLTGVEGYMESAACGIIAGINAVARLNMRKPLILPAYSMIGALLEYITNPLNVKFQPMGANFGVLPPLDEPVRDKRERYNRLAVRGLKCVEDALERRKE